MKNQRGQAMLETILLVTLVCLSIGIAFRALGVSIGQRQGDLETYYAQPGP